MKDEVLKTLLEEYKDFLLKLSEGSVLSLQYSKSLWPYVVTIDAQAVATGEERVEQDVSEVVVDDESEDDYD